SSILVNDSACGIPDAAIELLFFGGDAEKFVVEVLQRAQTQVLGLAHPGLRVDRRIRKRDHQLHIVPIQTMISLLESHLIAVRIAKMIEPGSLVKTIG